MAASRGPTRVLCALPLQYPDGRTADVAKSALQGHSMYDGGHNVVSACKTRLVLASLLGES